jgi:hypothetical protein
MLDEVDVIAGVSGGSDWSSPPLNSRGSGRCDAMPTKWSGCLILVNLASMAEG